MPQPSLSPVKIGACALVYGDPYKNPASATQADADAALMYLGPTAGDVTVTPNLEVALMQVDQSAAPIAAYGSWTGMVVDAPLTDQTKARLAAYWPGTVLSANREGLGFQQGVFSIAPKVLGLIPLDELALGLNAPNAVWLVNAVANNVGQVVFRKFDTSQQTFAPPTRATQFTSLNRPTLGVKPSFTVPAHARTGYFGTVTNGIGSTEAALWLLPDLTTTPLVPG